MHMRTIFSRLRARTGPVLALAMLVAASGCADLFVPDHNNPALDDVENNPTPGAVRALATGLLIGARQDLTDRTSYTSQLGIIGREAYILDGSDPRYISELLIGPLTNSGAFGGGLWAQRYQNIRNANILLNAVQRLSDDEVAGIPPAGKEGIRGFAKTMQALDFLLIINTRHTNGAPIDVNTAVNAPPAPLATRAQVFAHIAALLDQADAHLAAAGPAFAFPLSPGLQGFDSPATFRQVNRALKARVDAYVGNYGSALNNLNASFVNTGAPLTRGAYHSFGTASGDAANLLTNTNIYAHPSIVTDAEARPGGGQDLRLSKVVTVDPRTVSGITSNLRFTLYTAASAPLPIIRNEELILLRAEARWFTGDHAGATDDLNHVRTTAGGLAVIAQPASDADFVTELLRQRRYSLLFEGGHRWIDSRRFNRLGDLPRDGANHTVHTAFGIPEAECLARNLSSTCSAGS